MTTYGRGRTVPFARARARDQRHGRLGLMGQRGVVPAREIGLELCERRDVHVHHMAGLVEAVRDVASQ